MLAALRAARPDLVALAGFAAILADVVVDAFAGRILNIHPSLLPAFAGSVAPGPQAAALAAGVAVSGCTVHLVTVDVDAGPIVAQAEVPVLPGDTVDSLSDRILAAEHRLYPQVLGRFDRSDRSAGSAVDRIAAKVRVSGREAPLPSIRVAFGSGGRGNWRAPSFGSGGTTAGVLRIDDEDDSCARMPYASSRWRSGLASASWPVGRRV